MKKGYLLGLIVASAFTLRADIIPTLDPNPPAPAVGGFTWNYSVNVTVDQMINTGDYFTIYDFGNFLAGSNLQPADWTFSSSLVGTTPALVNPTDNASLLNLTWTYIGQESILGSSLVGQFSVITDTDQLRTSQFAAEATRSNGPEAGSKVDNIGNVSVPVPEVSALLPVLSVVAAALLSMVPSALRRRKAS